MKSKTLTLLVLLQICSHSCEHNGDIEGIWISNEWTQSLDSDEYRKIKEEITRDKGNYSKDLGLHLDSMYNLTITDKLIYQFEKDSLRVTRFNRTRYEGYTKHVFEYDYTKDTLVLTKDTQKIISYEVEQLTEEKLVLSHYDEQSFLQENRLIFQPLRKFAAKNGIVDVDSFLAGNKFMIEKTDTEIFFQRPSRYEGGEIVVRNPNTSFDLNSDDNWHLINIEGELFLVAGAEVIQIIEIQNDKLIGYIYRKKIEKYH